MPRAAVACCRRSHETRSDLELIDAIRAGDETAFNSLYDRYFQRVYNFSYARVRNAADAEEAVQETFLCAHRWLATYDSRFSFRTWLWTILLNQCSRVAKREAKHVALTPALSQR